MTDTIHGECMLLSWSEHHSRGATITIALSDPDDLTPFKRLTVAKAKMAGQRLMYAFAEVGDDEKPIANTEPKGGPLAKLAAMLCVQREFQSWCGDYGTTDDAADYVRKVCMINSRADLDHDPEAADRFHRLIRIPFLESQGKA